MVFETEFDFLSLNMLQAHILLPIYYHDFLHNISNVHIQYHLHCFYLFLFYMVSASPFYTKMYWTKHSWIPKWLGW